MVTRHTWPVDETSVWPSCTSVRRHRIDSAFRRFINFPAMSRNWPVDHRGSVGRHIGTPALDGAVLTSYWQLSLLKWSGQSVAGCFQLDGGALWPSTLLSCETLFRCCWCSVFFLYSPFVHLFSVMWPESWRPVSARDCPHLQNRPC